MEGLFLWLKKYFIPHEDNNHKPHFLREKSMLFFLILIIVAELGFITQVFFVFDKTNFLASVLPGVITTLTNEERINNNVGLLAPNELLNKAAQLKAEDMATHSYFAHTSPDGKTPWYWFNQVGYKYSHAGENLAVNFFESEDVARAWMNSPSHRANIVKKDFTEIGVGVANGIYKGEHTVFVAQLFGTPIKIIPLTENTAPVNTPVVASVSRPVPATPTPAAPKIITAPVVTPNTEETPAPRETEVLNEEIDLVVANSDTDEAAAGTVKSFIQKILTSPRQSLAYVYQIIALLILLALMLAVFIKHKVQHPSLIFRGIAIIAVISLLSLFNFRVLNLESSVPASDISANTISALPAGNK